MPQRVYGGVARTEITNILVRDSLWDNIFYLPVRFQDVNGFFNAVSGTAAITILQGIVNLATGATAASVAELNVMLDFPNVLTGLLFCSWNENRRIRGGVHFSNNTNQTIYITSGGVGGGFPSNYFGFKVVNNQLFGCTMDNVTESLTAVLATILAGDDFLLEARFTPGVDCRFYVNGVYVGVLTTTLPTGPPGTVDSDELIHFSIVNGAAANKQVSFNLWEFYQAR